MEKIVEGDEYFRAADESLECRQNNGALSARKVVIKVDPFVLAVRICEHSACCYVATVCTSMKASGL